LSVVTEVETFHNFFSLFRGFQMLMMCNWNNFWATVFDSGMSC